MEQLFAGLEKILTRFRLPVLLGAVTLLASAIVGAGIVQSDSRLQSAKSNKPGSAVSHYDPPIPPVPPAIENRSSSAGQKPTAQPFTGPRKDRKPLEAAVSEPSDDLVSISGALPVLKEVFRAEMLPGAEWLSLADESFDCWTDDSLMKKASRVFEADRPGMLKVEAMLPHLWSIELTDENEEYGSSEYYVTGWLALYADEGARLVLPLEAGRKIRISGCNYGSLQTSIEITYEFDLNRVIDSPRQTAAGLNYITPNQLTRLNERVPVNFVFLGFEDGQVDFEAFSDRLPKRYQPVARIPYFYGLKHSLGIDYTYSYRTVVTSKAYENQFFEYVQAIGEPAPVTTYQRAYNVQNCCIDGLPNSSSRQPRRTIQNNFVIDATRVEKWLAENPPAGINSAEYTVYFLNWYGRTDFTHHVFSHLGEVDPDVHRDFGEEDTGKIIAWGGTPPDDPETGLGLLSRVWFYDFSAGPDWRTGNWNLSSSDRIPPIWEYHDQGARNPNNLSIDMAQIARYVAIDLLFTPSPLYPPGLTPPRLPESIQIDLATYEGIPGFDGSRAWLKPARMSESYGLLLPLNKISVTSTDLDPAQPDFVSCYSGWLVGLGIAPSCAKDRPYRDWSNLFVHHGLNYSSLTKEQTSAVDYNILGLLYATPDQVSAYAYADDNQRDGTQSFLHNFMSYAYNGDFGMTNIMIHEGGHHFGLSHPHDGYDWEEDVDFAAQITGWRFAWIGDESSTVMNYMDINNDFSQFDRDNINRWHTAAYSTAVNAIAGKILKSERKAETYKALRRSDALVGEASRLFSEHRYLDAAIQAKEAYATTLRAAERIGLEVRASRNGFTVDRQGQLMHDYAPPEYAYGDNLRDFPVFERLRSRPAQRSNGRPIPPTRAALSM